MLQCKVGALGIVYVEDHHSRNRQLLGRSNKVVALQSSTINLDARKQLSGIKACGNCVEVVHIVALGVETVGIKLVVDVVYGRTVVGEQVRVYRRSAAKWSDRRHADGAGGLQVRNQLADASGESSTA